MKIRNLNWLAIYVLSQIIFFISYPVQAEMADDYMSTMSREKFERTINHQFQYINKRLLNKKVIGKIENSENDEAIRLLNRARGMRDDIEEQIKANRYKNAYALLQKLNDFLSEAMRISRSRDRAEKKVIDDMERAKIVNDAYLERAQKRFINKLDSNKEAASSYQSAIEKKNQADKAKSGNEFKKATIEFNESTKLLKKMIATIRKSGKPNVVVLEPEIEMFGEE